LALHDDEFDIRLGCHDLTKCVVHRKVSVSQLGNAGRSGPRVTTLDPKRQFLASAMMLVNEAGLLTPNGSADANPGASEVDDVRDQGRAPNAWR